MKQSEIDTRFIGALYQIGIVAGQPNYFEQSSLFWSLNRLFAFYFRIVSVYNPKTGFHGDKSFLDADLESYIIRHRIILNDLAYSIWQLLKLLGINLNAHPKGKTHPRNMELSFFDLEKKLRADSGPKLEKLRSAFQRGMTEFGFLRDQRDNIAHYKSSVMVFGDGPDFEFAIMNSAGTEPMITSEGKTKLVLKNVFTFINSQHKFLWDWMNGELTDAMIDMCRDSGMQIDPDKFATKLSGYVSVALYKVINDIK